MYIDYCPQCANGKKLNVSYGLSNLDLFHNFSTYILDSKYEINFTSLASQGSKNNENLSAEITILLIDANNEEISYNTYFAWFELLISFATGKCLKRIYRTETIQSGNQTKKIEFWSGSRIFRNSNGIAVMQKVHLPLFIQQCASKVTCETFSKKGLGSALRWYIEAFSSNTVSVEFIMLCTVLETLNKHHLSEVSSRLIPKAIYRQIRNEVFNILDKYETDISDEEDLQKYKIFKNKLENSFSNFNKLGSLRTSLKQILEFYKTPYEDLFPELEFIKIRDDIIHTGFGGDNIFTDLRKLGNLVVRLILSILEYHGDYIESRKVEIANSTDFNKYALAYKTFPF